jgi:hypothetical protein
MCILHNLAFSRRLHSASVGWRINQFSGAVRRARIARQANEQMNHSRRFRDEHLKQYAALVRERQHPTLKVSMAIR